jgi:hypothetical protein
MAEAAMNRFACPGCGKVLKVRADWAGRAATCPACHATLTIPAAPDVPASSRIARQLAELVGADESETERSLDDRDAEQLAMLLAQGTCRDYGLARKLLSAQARKPAAREWRRILNSAAAQESLRTKIEEAVAEGQDRGSLGEGNGKADAEAEPIPLLVAQENHAPRAWTILSRYLYYLSHDACDACREDPTGLACMYLNFERFLAARRINEERAAGWHAAIQQHLGI